MKHKKKYVKVLPNAVCEKETFDRFCEEIEKNPELIDTFIACIDNQLVDLGPSKGKFDTYYKPTIKAKENKK